MKTIVRKPSTDGVTAHKATPTACYSLINSGIRNFAPHLLTPRGKGFSNTPVSIYVFSNFILMLRATLHAVVGPLNHNQLNLVHVCVWCWNWLQEVQHAGSGVGGTCEICQVMSGVEERGVTLRRRRGGRVALSSFLYL